MSPKVTVLMPVYNGEAYLKDAVESILNQTFADFEFLIIDDASNDNSAGIIQSYDDSRIRLVNNDRNMGLAASLNKGLKLAKGEYIARMDCDDISLPERLEKQVRFLESNPEIGICGTWIEEFNENVSKVFKYPVSPEEIKAKLFFFSALAHPTVIMRKSIIQKYDLNYNENYPLAQDYDFWRQCSRFFQLGNLPETLLRYRVSSNSDKSNKRSEVLKQIDRENLALMGIKINNDDLELHQAICPLRYPPMPINQEFVIQADIWLQKIYQANQNTKIYPERVFSQLIGERWFAVCNKNSEGLGFWVWHKFWKSPLSQLAALDIKKNVGLTINCLKSQINKIKR